MCGRGDSKSRIFNTGTRASPHAGKKSPFQKGIKMAGVGASLKAGSDFVPAFPLPGPGENGKKDEKPAKSAGKGKFAVSAPPRLATVLNMPNPG